MVLAGPHWGRSTSSSELPRCTAPHAASNGSRPCRPASSPTDGAGAADRGAVARGGGDRLDPRPGAGPARIPTEHQPLPPYAWWMAALDRFSPITRAWFTTTFASPTP